VGVVLAVATVLETATPLVDVYIALRAQCIPRNFLEIRTDFHKPTALRRRLRSVRQDALAQYHGLADFVVLVPEVRAWAPSVIFEAISVPASVSKTIAVATSFWVVAKVLEIDVFLSDLEMVHSSL
jgi:hypothetical protein